MFATLYRYPHPHDASKFIYCGQESNNKTGKGGSREKHHRSGWSSFGRRFQKLFPGVELSQPIREVVEVQDQLELNELETIWMFRYHTWWGYDGGMNLTLPGGQDYKNIGILGVRSQPREAKVRGGRIGGSIGGRIGGPIAGRKAVESGQIQRLGRKNVESGHLARLDQGRKNVESGHMAKLNNSDKVVASRRSFTPAKKLHLDSVRPKDLGRRNVESGHLARLNCLQWNVRRGKTCTCGTHEQQAAA